MGTCKSRIDDVAAKPRLISALLWIVPLTVAVCRPSPAYAKPQVSASCPTNFNSASGSLTLTLSYNQGNSNEPSWDNYISVDEHIDGSEVSGYPVDGGDLKNFSYPNSGSISEGYAFTGTLDTTAIVYFSVSGEWNGTAAWSTWSATFYCPEVCCPTYDRCVPACCYGAPAAPATSTGWGVKVKSTDSSGGKGTVILTLDPGNADATLYVKYCIRTGATKRTAGDDGDETERTGIVADNTGAYFRNVINTGGGGTKYYRLTANTTQDTQSADLQFDLPNTKFVYVDIFAVNTTTGETIVIDRGKGKVKGQ